MQAVLMGLVLAACNTAPAVWQEQQKLTEIVERIAKGDDPESADATERLIERVVAPLTDAIGSLEKRPAAEVVRLRAALGQLSAALRITLARADLPEEDRKLFDQFAKAYPDLLRQLFHDQVRMRAAAVQQIPLDPDSGAGVLITRRVDDEDETVAVAALDVAMKLRDKVVARNLNRWVKDVIATLRSGHYGPADSEVKMALAIFSQRAMRVIMAARYTEAYPDLLEAFRYFASPGAERWYPDAIAEVAMSFGELGDERAIPLLTALLDDPRLAELRSPGAGSPVAQTVGDGAFLALLRLLGFEPSKFGMTQTPGESGIAGFTDDGTRQAARQHLRQWMAENLSKPREQRVAPGPLPVGARPAATQPATQPDRVPR
jgi:hypothetical protein